MSKTPRSNVGRSTSAHGTRTASAVPADAVRVRRWAGRLAARADGDRVVVEEPLEIRLETRSLAVIMRTPGHDEELAAGFLLGEGVIRTPDELRAIRPHPRNREGNVLDVFLNTDRPVDFGRFTRHVFAASSCGLCGRASLEAVHRQFPPVRERFTVPAGVLSEMPARLRRAQPDFASTGGTHAAAMFGADGTLQVAREDVGRHNAVDKVVGRLLLDRRLPVCGGVLLVSGRASFEIVQKAVAARLAFVAAVGAPSSLAIALARRSGQTLVGFLRDGRFNVYTGIGRIGP